MNMPWADDKMPSPQEVRKAPSRSRTIKGCALRLNKYTRSRASVTMPVWPRVQPAGNCAQASTSAWVWAPVAAAGMVVSPVDGSLGTCCGAIWGPPQRLYTPPYSGPSREQLGLFVAQLSDGVKRASLQL